MASPLNFFFPIIVGVIISIYVYPLLPPGVEFVPYKLEPPVEFEGALALNGKLNNGERLFENKVKGPEGFAIFKNELYTSTHGGYIMKVVSDQELKPVIKVGKKCAGLWEEKICGRPLGLKFDSAGNLFFADAYSGIYKGNVTTGEKELIIPITQEVNGKRSMLPNSVEISRDGTIYWTDSSTTYSLEDGVFSMLANGNGRLIRYDPRTKTNEVLIDKIHFANGVALSKDESFIVVSETFKFRLLKYYLKGAKKGTHEVFIDRLPGNPDNLQTNEKGHIIVSLVVPEESNSFSIARSLAPYGWLRAGFANILTFIELIFKKADEFYPNLFAKKAVHWIGHFESTSWLLFKNRVTIIKLDEGGNVVEALYGTDGKISGISDYITFKGYHYLGSPFNNYLGRVKII